MAKLLDPTINVVDDYENDVRPICLKNFIGQQNIKDNLTVFINAALSRREQLDHILFCGPPGLGKTTLANITAREMKVGFYATSGPVIAKASDLSSILSKLQEFDVLFVDEIHRLNNSAEEILYSAMEDFKLDILIGEGPGARSVRIDLPRFTLIGATTRSGMLSKPLRDRFGINFTLHFYEVADLEIIVQKVAMNFGLSVTADGVLEIAKRSRGTPRIAIRLLRRVRDFANFEKTNHIDRDMANYALNQLHIDEFGLDDFDRRYLMQIAVNFGGGPVGIEALCAALSEDRGTIEYVIEPFLLQSGFIHRTNRGRIVSSDVYAVLGLEK